MLMRKSVALGLLLLLLARASRVPADELVAQAKIDALVQPLIDDGWLYGAAVGLVNEHGTQTAGYGKISAKNPAAPAADTEFEIGSITKVFTGLVLAQLVEEHRVTLDEPLQKLLGDSMHVPGGKDREMTLVDLSTHSSGLPRMPGNFRPKDQTDPFADYTVEQMAEFLAAHKLRRQPGDKYEYSNLAVGLLGHALALKCGQSYEEMVRQRICQPLDMRETCITLNEAQQARLAAGHDFDNHPAANWSIPTLAGAGALRSTTGDMLKFLAANLGFTKTPFDAALAASHVVHFKLPQGAGVALGWHVMADGVIWHNGGTGGYHSYAGFLPAKKAGVVVLSNTAIMHVDQLGRRLLDLLVSGEAQPLKLPHPITLDAAALDRLAGKYNLPPLANITVARDGDALEFEISGQPKIRLYPESPQRFFTRASADLAISFETDEAGAATKLVIHQSGQNVTAKRTVVIAENKNAPGRHLRATGSVCTYVARVRA